MYLNDYDQIVEVSLANACLSFQERLSESHRERENLIQEVSELDKQIGEVRGQLNQEKHNCRYVFSQLICIQHVYNTVTLYL